MSNASLRTSAYSLFSLLVSTPDLLFGIEQACEIIEHSALAMHQSLFSNVQCYSSAVHFPSSTLLLLLEARVSRSVPFFTVMGLLFLRIFFLGSFEA